MCECILGVREVGIITNLRTLGALDPRITRRAATRRIIWSTCALWASGCTSDSTDTHGAATDCLQQSPPPTPQNLPERLNPAHFVIHNRKPLALESKRHQRLSAALTASEHLFVRNNLPRPSQSILKDREAWQLTIKGVKTPQTLSLKQLKTMGPATTEVMVLQCSGNGRAFFDHGASGSQWATGAAGCVSWTGVKVADVIAHLGGVDTRARYLTGTGGEPLPSGVPRNKVIVERSVPLKKGLNDCLLAWKMNGQPIPLSHGGPLRLVVPGYFGCNQIKYIKTLAATAEQSPAKIQQKGYRFRPIGDSGAPQQPSMWRMPVKSWVMSALVKPQDTALNQRYTVQFAGVAFSGERGVSKVEVSIDQGITWRSARLTPTPDVKNQRSINAWHPFSVSLDLAKGTHQLVCRATDTLGEIQPKDRIENERGYGHNGWLDHGFTVSVGAQSAFSKNAQSDSDSKTRAALSRNELEEGRTLFAKASSPSCGTCHTLKDAQTMGKVGPNLDTLKPSAASVHRAIKNGVGAMPSYGDRLTESQLKTLSSYIEAVTKP